MLEIITKYMDESTALMKTFQENLSTLNKIAKANIKSAGAMITTIENLHQRVKTLEEKIN